MRSKLTTACILSARNEQFVEGIRTSAFVAYNEFLI